jgi:glycosyltransferase involved in cell wall biosynthesis
VPPARPLPDPAEFRRAHDIPADARLVIAAGELRAAVWAFEVLKYPTPDLYLVLAGNGPERGPAERFARALGFDDYRVRFTADVPAALGLADVAWVTSPRGGVTSALEAMAAGRPVVAAHTPELAEVVEDGVTGRLAPPADPVRLAAVTAELLGDPDQARRLGAAGRERAGQFPVAAASDRWSRLYERLAGG